jgi:hypothetical protein
MWSSAMIVSPAMRGLFGLQPDAVHSTLFVDPHLPATWDHARVRNVHLGKQTVDVEFTRDRGVLHVRATSAQPEVLCLSQVRSRQSCSEPASKGHELTLPLPAVEFALPDQAVRQGDSTHTIKVRDEIYSDRSASLKLAAPGDTQAELFVRTNRPNVSCDQHLIQGGRIALRFPQGNGYQELTVNCRW